MLKHTVVWSILLLVVGAAPVVAQSTYTIPDHLTPVSEWADGFTPEEADRFRLSYAAPDYALGNDNCAFAYLKLNEVITTKLVLRDGPVAELASRPRPEIGDVVATTDLGTMPLTAAMADERSRFQAIVVVHKGEIVYEAYPGMPARDKHVWNSASKTITGLLIHQLVNEGLVELAEEASTYLPYLADAPIGAIRVADLLHQRSGLDFEETQPNMENPAHPMGRALGGALTPRGVPAGESVKDVLAEVKPMRPPAEAFEYSTLNTQTLGFIVVSVTGKPWNQVVSERIWSKAGMEGDALLGLSAAGEGLYGGIFASRLRDLARFAMLFTPSWDRVSKERIVSEDYLGKVYAAADPAIYLKGHQGPRMVRAFGADDAPYGTSYQWDAVFRDGDLYKAGLNGQAIYVSPRTDAAVVYFSTAYRNSLSMISYARAIVKRLSDER
jgi:CubicO group peptidase (beta-lactamase class C family)